MPKEIKGIDVSAWNGNIDWKAVANDGIKYAILRITERYNKIDSTFENNFKGCSAVKIPIGVYKYSYAVNTTQIIEEANVVVKTLNGRKLDFPVFLDIEDKCQANLSPALMMKMIDAFRNVIVNAGYKFGIYCGYSWYQNKLPDGAKKYDCWLARYPYGDNGTIQERLRPPVGVAWQYSSKGRIKGISGNVDMNVFYKDYKNDTEGGKENMSKDWIMQVRKDAVEFAVAIANDNTHGYSQRVRSLYNITLPKSYDCSSLCCTAYYYAFIKNGLTKEANYLKSHCSYTGNMMNMLNCGFEVVARKQTAHGSMILGDLELNTTHHVAMAIDGNNIVHARSSEGTNDTIDNSGNEIRTQPWYLYSHGWTHRLRFTGKGVHYSGNTSNIKPPTSHSKPNLITRPLNKTTKYTGIVTANSLNVRVQPTTDADKCSFGPLKKGAVVNVCDTINGWHYICQEGKYGFVSAKYVTKNSSQDTPQKPESAPQKPSVPAGRKFVGCVYKPVTKVYKDAQSKELLSEYPQLRNGNMVDVLAEKGKRYKVNIPVPGGLIGYVNKSDIKDSKKEYPYLAKVHTNGGTLNLREKPVDGNTIVQMPNHANVIVRKKAKEKGWYEIRYKKQIGYASGEYLRKA